MRKLSFNSDKLLAVAGLARLMQENYDLTYAAGLWKEDLQNGLCWFVDCTINPDEAGSINGEFPDYLAPTWSWASAYGKTVNFEYARKEQLPERGIQILDLEVFHLSGDLAAFGCITSAKLSICTKKRRAVLVPRSTRLELCIPFGHLNGLFRYPLYAVDPLMESFVGLVALDSMEVHEGVSRQYQDSQMGKTRSSAVGGTANQAFCNRQLSSGGFEVWCVPCVVGTYPERPPTMSALVLTASNADRHEYRRIGYMQVENLDFFSNDYFHNSFVVERDLHQDFEVIHIV
jgi:hypothetical protein